MIYHFDGLSIYLSIYILVVEALLTLHYSHQPSADPRHHVTQQPLFHPVDLDPANDG